MATTEFRCDHKKCRVPRFAAILHANGAFVRAAHEASVQGIASLRTYQADCLAAELGVLGGCRNNDGILVEESPYLDDVIAHARCSFGLSAEASTVSAVSLFRVRDDGGSESMLAFADGGVNAHPSADQLADIAVVTCDTYRKVAGCEARCALLSFSSDGESDRESPVRVRQAVLNAAQRRPDLKIDGEFQLDAAIDARIASIKVRRDSAVAGRANVLVFPTLSACGIGVQLVRRFSSCHYLGTFIQGLRMPLGIIESECSTKEALDLIAIFSTMCAK